MSASSVPGDLGPDPRIEIDARNIPDVVEHPGGSGVRMEFAALGIPEGAQFPATQEARCSSTSVLRPEPVRALVRLLRPATAERILGQSPESSELPSIKGFFTVHDLYQEMAPPAASKAELMARYIFMEKLLAEDPEIYFDALRKHPHTFLQVVHAPTSGLAAQTMHIFVEKPRGLFLPAASWLRELTDSGIDTRSHEGRRTVKSYVLAALNKCSEEAAFPELRHGNGLGAMLVVTDGSRTLGLGDQGAGGIAIPMGITSAYVSIAGFRRQRVVPVVVDFGMDPLMAEWLDGKTCTDQPESAVFGSCRKAQMAQWFGTGLERFNDMDQHIYPVMDAFVETVRLLWPQAVVQWHGWKGDKAALLLQRHRGVTYAWETSPVPLNVTTALSATYAIGAHRTIRSFNGNIHGLGVMVFAALFSASKRIHVPLSDLRILIAGTGATATGVADLIVQGILHAQAASLDDEEAKAHARKRIVFVDFHGLVTRSSPASQRTAPYAEAQAFTEDAQWSCNPAFGEGVECMRDVLIRYIPVFQPHVLIGLSGVGGLFDADVLGAMRTATLPSNHTTTGTRPKARPIIFALSTPASNAECTAQEAYEKTRGLAIYASTSKFAPYSQDPEPELRPSDMDDMLVLPGIAEAAAFGLFDRGLPEDIFIVAAQALAEQVLKAEELHTQVLPDRRRLADVNQGVCDNMLLYSIRNYKQRMGAADPKDTRGLTWAERPVMARTFLRSFLTI